MFKSIAGFWDPILPAFINSSIFNYIVLSSSASSVNGSTRVMHITLKLLPILIAAVTSGL
jgi:hypothetical protein